MSFYLQLQLLTREDYGVPSYKLDKTRKIIMNLCNTKQEDLWTGRKDKAILRKKVLINNILQAVQKEIHEEKKVAKRRRPCRAPTNPILDMFTNTSSGVISCSYSTNRSQDAKEDMDEFLDISPNTSIGVVSSSDNTNESLIELKCWEVEKALTEFHLPCLIEPLEGLPQPKKMKIEHAPGTVDLENWDDAFFNVLSEFDITR